MICKQDNSKFNLFNGVFHQNTHRVEPLNTLKYYENNIIITALISANVLLVRKDLYNEMIDLSLQRWSAIFAKLIWNIGYI